MDGRGFGDGERTESVSHRGGRYGVLSGTPSSFGNAAYAGAAGCDLGHDCGLCAVSGVAAFGCVQTSEFGGTVVWGGWLCRSGSVLSRLAALVSASGDAADGGDSCAGTGAGWGKARACWEGGVDRAIHWVSGACCLPGLF